MDNDSKKEQEEAKEIEQKLKTMLRTVLTEEAYNRISNIKVANQELYIAAAKSLVAIHQRVGRRIDDNELQQVLRSLLSQKERETTIKFNRK